MSRDMKLLRPEFRAKIESLLAELKRDGYEYRPFYTFRDPHEQAKLWRQSRSTREINERLKYLHDTGNHICCAIIESVGPQSGRWATNAIPGMSEHQYGSAIDVFRVMSNGSADWSSSAYAPMAHRAKALGLESGYFWNTQDAVHIEDKPPLRPRVMNQVDAALRTHLLNWLAEHKYV